MTVATQPAPGSTTATTTPEQARFAAASALAVSGLFDAQAYLAAHPDVAASDMDPVWHYVAYGQGEKRALGVAKEKAQQIESLVREHLSHSLAVSQARQPEAPPKPKPSKGK